MDEDSRDTTDARYCSVSTLIGQFVCVRRLLLFAEDIFSRLGVGKALSGGPI